MLAGMRAPRRPRSEEHDTEARVRAFYEEEGWAADDSGETLDTRLWEVRDSASEYTAKCDAKILQHVAAEGDAFLDAGSGPARRADYLQSYGRFRHRYCVDVSARALELARAKLGTASSYVQASLLALPFDDDFFDTAIANHVVYHIHAKAQERAVRELIRTTKPGRPIVIVYRNPLAPLDALQTLYRASGLSRLLAGGEVYFHVHPLRWWRRFTDTCEVDLFPWHVLSARFVRTLVPDNALGRRMFQAFSAFEDRFPRAAVALWSYPLVRLVKRRPENTKTPVRRT